MTATTTAPDFKAIRNAQQAMWADGDFDAVAVSMVIVGELLCEAVDVHPGQRVLDVATGSGNTAIAAARRGADVIGTDYVPELLERARERAAAERLPIMFEQADADDQPFPDATFDVVLTTFGAMFAPDQHNAARELLRVTKSGGKISMAIWLPVGNVAALFKTLAKYAPSPPNLDPPLLWGHEDRLRELLGDGLADLQTNRRQCMLRARSAHAWLDHYRQTFGPVIRTFAALDSGQQDELAEALVAQIDRENMATDGTLKVPLDYLEVVAVRR